MAHCDFVKNSILHHPSAAFQETAAIVQTDFIFVVRQVELIFDSIRNENKYCYWIIQNATQDPTLNLIMRLQFKSQPMYMSISLTYREFISMRFAVSVLEWVILVVLMLANLGRVQSGAWDRWNAMSDHAKYDGQYRDRQNLFPVRQIEFAND